MEKLRPTLTYDRACKLAVEVSLRAAFPDRPLPEQVNYSGPLTVVFENVRKRGVMPVETGYRILRAEMPDAPEWGQHDKTVEIGLAVFIACADALCGIAAKQALAFEAAKLAKAGEGRLARHRQRIAGRRAKRQERKARAPEAKRKYLEIQKRNLAAAAKPKQATTPAKVDLSAARLRGAKAAVTQAKKKPNTKGRK